MSPASLGAAFVTALAVHLGALMVLSIAWGWLRAFSPPANLPEPEFMMVAPVLQPVAPMEPGDSTAPSPTTTEEVTTVPSSPPLVDEPIAPQKVDPITPPKIIEKTAPTRAAPRPKPRTAPKATQARKSPPDQTHEPASEPRDTPIGSDEGTSKSGHRQSFPNDTTETAAGNVLGPPSATKAGEHPPTAVEGGEAGAGNLFDKGKVGVIPGAGVGGGSGAGGSGGLGLGDEGRGLRLGGGRRGPDGDGTGEGGSSTSPPTGGYQVKPRYPDAARRRGIEGTVVVKAYVTTQGRVEGVQVEQSAGHADLDQAAIEAVGRWRFEPARRGRQPVAMWVSIPVQFVLNR